MLLCEMLTKCESSRQTSTKNPQHKISGNLAPREPCCYTRTDGRSVELQDRQTDMTKLIIVFRNFVSAAKKVKTENARQKQETVPFKDCHVSFADRNSK